MKNWNLAKATGITYVGNKRKRVKIIENLEERDCATKKRGTNDNPFHKH